MNRMKAFQPRSYEKNEKKDAINATKIRTRQYPSLQYRHSNKTECEGVVEIINKSMYGIKLPRNL